jgi:anti-sigma factor RsiW
VTCREFAEFIAQYLASELPSAQQEAFDRHLSLCTNCAQYLEQYRRTMEWSRLAFDKDEAPLPADVPQDLIEAILRARKAARPD